MATYRETYREENGVVTGGPVDPDSGGQSVATTSQNSTSIHNELNDVNSGHDGMMRKFKTHRLLSVYNSDPHLGGYTWIFMTRPNLNFTSEMNLSYLKCGNGRVARDILASLSMDVTGVIECGFMPLLSNSFKTAPVLDLSADQHEMAENWHGNKMAFGGDAIKARTNVDFQIGYEEHMGLPITHLHKLWVEYIEGAKLGYVSRTANYKDYLLFDYLSSLYVFSTDPDGFTINYWAKYTGVFPRAVPFTNLGVEDTRQHNPAELHIPYTANYVEHMNIDIFSDFNLHVSGGGGSVTAESMPYIPPAVMPYYSESKVNLQSWDPGASDTQNKFAESNKPQIVKIQPGSADHGHYPSVHGGEKFALIFS